MEKDNTQYFNDEWNVRLSHKKVIKELQLEYNKKLDNFFRQLACQCNLPRPNSFTGNCTSCNKIIKPIIDKDVNKYTK